jgi:hypothetical protein
MKRTRFTAAVAGAILTAAVLLSSCGSGGEPSNAAGAAQPAGGAGELPTKPGTAVTENDPDGKAASGAAAQPAVTRAIVRTAFLTVETPKVDEARQQVSTIVTGLRGLIATENSGIEADGNIPRAELVLRVPSASYDVAVRRLQTELDGKVTQIRQESADVTEQVVDVDSRIATQRAGLNRMRALLAKADTIGEIVSVEGELTRREADLESLLAKQKALAGQTELATITLTLAQPGEAPAPEEDNRGFLVGLKNGWNAFSSTISALATAAGALLPFALLLTALTLPLYFLRHRRRLPIVRP